MKIVEERETSVKNEIIKRWLSHYRPRLECRGVLLTPELFAELKEELKAIQRQPQDTKGGLDMGLWIALPGYKEVRVYIISYEFNDIGFAI